MPWGPPWEFIVVVRTHGGSLRLAAHCCQGVRCAVSSDDEFDEEGTAPATGGTEAVREIFQRLDPRRLDAHAARELHPVERGPREVEKVGRRGPGLRAHGGELALQDGVAPVGEDDIDDVELLA